MALEVRLELLSGEKKLGEVVIDFVPRPGETVPLNGRLFQVKGDVAKIGDENRFFGFVQVEKVPA